MPSRSVYMFSLSPLPQECLSGHRFFSGSTTEIITQHLYNPPPVLRSKVPTIPPVAEQVIFRALEKDPQQRFPTIRAFAEAFVQASPPEVEQTVSSVGSIAIAPQPPPPQRSQ